MKAKYVSELGNKQALRRLLSIFNLPALLRRLRQSNLPLLPADETVHVGSVENYDPQDGLMMACGQDNPEIILPALSPMDEAAVREYLRLGKNLGFLFSMMAYGPIIEERHIRMAQEFIAAETAYARLGFKPIGAEAFVSLGGWHKPLPESEAVCLKLPEGEEPVFQGPRFLRELNG